MQEVRIVAPSLSLNETDQEKIKKVRTYFSKMGYTVTLGKNIFEKDSYFGCASVQSRVSDLMEAFKDPCVKIIVCADGGYNVNQILPYLDFTMIKNNPKMIIGYSDITALLLAITTQTAITTYYGPMLSGFSKQNAYTISSFEKLWLQGSITVTPSTEIFDYTKEKEQTELVTLQNEGMAILQEGNCTGKIIGGNLCTLNLLQGTKYMPSLKDVVLFIEDDADDFGNDVFLLELDRNLESLLQQENSTIKGIVFGRFQLCSHMTIDKLKSIVKGKEKLKDIPIIAGADFGHTNPMITIPLGGTCMLDVQNNKIEMKLIK